MGGAAAALYFAGDRISDQIHYLLASSSGGDLAPVPQPRSSGTQNPAAADLAEMPALVATDGAAPESWPALAPADLLAQSTALGDRALQDTAFDQPPWRRFARPFAAPAGKPLIGLLVTGLGLDRAATAAAIAGLPPEVSLSFSPAAKDLAQWIAAARAFGHEALVDLPLQSKDRRDLGADGILIGLNAGEAARRLQAIADSAPAVLGFAGAGGDALLLDDGTTAILAGEIARLGLAFIDTSGEPMSQILPAAQESGLAAARSTVTFDLGMSRAAITRQLATAAEVAQEEGHALAVAPVSPTTVTLLADWLRELGAPDPLPAPASALLQR
ncbi:divergent polysaccharide deacetylase family protein [Dongia sp. agr-C8]